VGTEGSGGKSDFKSKSSTQHICSRPWTVGLVLDATRKTLIVQRRFQCPRLSRGIRTAVERVWYGKDRNTVFSFVSQKMVPTVELLTTPTGSLKYCLTKSYGSFICIAIANGD
jgi:hypothetical protein